MQKEQHSSGRLRKGVKEHLESTTCHNFVVLMGLVCRQDTVYTVSQYRLDTLFLVMIWEWLGFIKAKQAPFILELLDLEASHCGTHDNGLFHFISIHPPLRSAN